MPRAMKAPVRKTCVLCSTAFSTTDSRKLFCSRSCKDTARNQSNATVEAATSASTGSRHQARRNEERRAAQTWMYETIFGTTPKFRADVVMALLVFAATSRNSDDTGAKRYRDILTYPTAQRSNRFTAKDKGTAHLHYRGQPMTFPVTIASMANHVCKFHLGMSSSELIDEIRRDGVTMADMQDVYDDLMDTTKPEPVIRGCDVEEPAWDAPLEDLTASQIAHARAVLADPMSAAQQAHEIGMARILGANDLNTEKADTFTSDMRRIDEEVQTAQQRVDAYLASRAGALAAANARFKQLIAAE